MNSLSWMIYAAGAANGLGVIAVGFGMTSVFVGAAAYLYSRTIPERQKDYYGKYQDNDGFVQEVAERVACRPLAKRFVFSGVCLLVAAAILPSASTIYMIAASEAGETIVKSPEAKEVFDDLKTIIKSKLKEQLPKP